MPPMSPPRVASWTERGRSWRLIMLRCSTKTLSFFGSVRTTRPVLPASLPPITTTWSSLRIRIDLAISEHLRGQRDDFHEVAVAQLASDGAEDAGATWVIAGGIDQHGGVFVEGDIGAVG